MGMYDEVKCLKTLPGTLPNFMIANGEDEVFQTKDFDCLMNLYVITPEGQLTKDGLPEKFTGAINFYTSNIAAMGPGIYTSTGEDYESVEYHATFVDGLMTAFEQTAYEKKPAWPMSKFRLIAEQPTEEEKAAELAIFNASRLGQTLYVLWGGTNAKGYTAKVVAENNKQFVLQKEDTDFELVHRVQFGNTLFLTAEEAHAQRDAKNLRWKTEQEEYDAFVLARQGGLVDNPQ